MADITLKIKISIIVMEADAAPVLLKGSPPPLLLAKR